jgi:hypothetical protein
VFSLARTGTDFGRAGHGLLAEASVLSILNFWVRRTSSSVAALDKCGASVFVSPSVVSNFSSDNALATEWHGKPASHGIA